MPLLWPALTAVRQDPVCAAEPYELWVAPFSAFCVPSSVCSQTANCSRFACMAAEPGALSPANEAGGNSDAAGELGQQRQGQPEHAARGLVQQRGRPDGDMAHIAAWSSR